MSTKRRSGLHKEISSIFDGVPLPKSNDATGSVEDNRPADNTAGHLPPTPAASPQPPQTWSKESGKDNQPVRTSYQKPMPQNKTRSLGKSGKISEVLLQQLRDRVLTPPEGVSQSRHTATLVLIPVLLLVVVFVFGRLLLQSGVKGSKSDGNGSFSTAIAPKTEIQWEKPSSYPADLRDPMKEFSYSASPNATGAGDIVVRGIVWSEDSPAAVIGTEIIYRGQTVKGAKILNITKDSVEFERDGEAWTQKVAE